MERKYRVGIMGGTFNPVHIAHLILAENAYREFDLDSVMILPNGDPPHKAIEKLSDNHARVEMLRLAVENTPYFCLSEMEMQRKGLSYTSDTLAELNRRHPDTDYYFIMGADSLFQIETWHEPDRIMASCIILAAVRDHHSMEEMEAQAGHLRRKFGADIRLMHVPALDLSSSDIRKRVSEGHSIRYMVPEKVESYIKEHHLYLERS